MTMENFKKLSRNELRSVKGAGPNWACLPNSCPPGKLLSPWKVAGYCKSMLYMC
ncbi:bacteriocin-like protein [Chryseobacterium lathyri]|uniref:bacteriocin-like protein n=1 Tax=Chryseobacterium lathyri TaxID=395933 RepID=UPI00403882F0